MDNAPNTDTIPTDSGLSPQNQATLAQWQAEGIIPAEDAPVNEPSLLPTINTDALPDLFGGQVRPVDYVFEQPTNEGEAMPMFEQVEIRNLLAQEGIPPQLVGEMSRRWNVAAGAKQSDVDLQIGMATCEAQLTAVYRDRTPEVLKLARGEARRLMQRSPAIRQALSETQFGNDSWLIGTLANLAEARAAKK